MSQPQLTRGAQETAPPLSPCLPRQVREVLTIYGDVVLNVCTVGNARSSSAALRHRRG